MRPRHIIAVLATALGLMLVLRFKTPQTHPTALGSTSHPPAVQQRSPSASGDVEPIASPSPSTQSRGRYRDGTYTGEDVYTRFGDVEVKVIVAGGRITDVQPVYLPYDHERSLFISQQAAPILHDEVLQAQSGNIDLLSGATYTSDAYARSVQAALDRAH